MQQHPPSHFIQRMQLANHYLKERSIQLWNSLEYSIVLNYYVPYTKQLLPIYNPLFQNIAPMIKTNPLM